MRFKKGDKVELANGTPIVIVGEYAAHDGQGYRARWDDGRSDTIVRIDARNSAGVRERTPENGVTVLDKQFSSPIGWVEISRVNGHYYVDVNINSVGVSPRNVHQSTDEGKAFAVANAMRKLIGA